MTKEQFIELGLAEEQAAKAAEISRREMEGYVSKSEYDAVEELKKQLAKDIKVRDADITELKKSVGTDLGLQKKYEDLQAKYKNSQIDSALDLAILSAKGKNTKAIKALIDREQIKMNEDGTIEGLDLESIKTSDSYLFETVETKNVGTESKGADTAAPAVTDTIKAQFESALFGN